MAKVDPLYRHLQQVVEILEARYGENTEEIRLTPAAGGNVAFQHYRRDEKYPSVGEVRSDES